MRMHRRIRHVCGVAAVVLLATAASAPAGQTISYSQYGTTVSGTGGGANTTVTVSQQRSAYASVSATFVNQDLGSASAPTDGAGAWSVNLSHGVIGSDSLIIHFAAGPPDTTASLPYYFTQGVGTVNAAGTAYTFQTSGCSLFRLTIDGGAEQALTQAGSNCTYTFSPAVTAANVVRLVYSNNLGGGDILKPSTMVPLPGQAVVPSCFAGVSTARVLCAGSDPATSVLVRHRSGAPDATATPVPASNGRVAGAFDSIATGDTVELRTTSPVNHAATILHIPTLTANFVTDANEVFRFSGTCAPGLVLTYQLCDTTGTYALDAAAFALIGLPAITSVEGDDQSAGSVIADVPLINHKAPAADASITLPFSASAIASAVDPAQNLVTSTLPVGLSVTPHGGGAPVVTSSNVNAAPGVSLGLLAAGRYDAVWTLANGRDDSRVDRTQFVVQGAATGPAGTGGAAGPSGTPGSAGPAGSTPGIRCTTTVASIAARRAARSATKPLACTLRLAAAKRAKTAKVSLALRRGRTKVAKASGTLRGGRSLRTSFPVRSAPRAGAYTLAVTVVRGRTKTTYSEAVTVVSGGVGKVYLDQVIVV